MSIPRKTRVGGAVAGLVTVLGAVAAAEGAAAVLGTIAPVEAVGTVAIDLAPPALKDLAVRTFGEADKPVLVGGVFVVLAVVGLGVGLLGVRRPRLAVAIAGGVAVLGLAAALLSRSDTAPAVVRVVPGLVAAVVSVVALGVLLKILRFPSAFAAVDSSGSGGDELPNGFDRRKFVGAALAVCGVGIAGAGTAGVVAGGEATTRAAVRIPRPSSRARPIAASTKFEIPGLTRFVTPAKSFYRVDTALSPPEVDVRGWTLRVHGLVDRELELDFEQLVSRRLVERDVTLTCVSNEVGGSYVGNARWIGVPIAELLAEAGVAKDADAVKSTAVDGITIGTPLAALTDGRDALFAVAMNGEPLTAVHGFPVRMVVPGLYGYVSATKWLVEVEVTRFADFQAYWTTRGWAEQAPIKTSSRIDVPRSFAKVRTGQVDVAGVAWSQQRGISAVEVRADEGPWQRARLAEEHSVDTWRQWVWKWDAKPGTHRLEVRAIDGTGRTQTSRRADIRPNGSTGWHSTVVTVE